MPRRNLQTPRTSLTGEARGALGNRPAAPVCKTLRKVSLRCGMPGCKDQAVAQVRNEVRRFGQKVAQLGHKAGPCPAVVLPLGKNRTHARAVKLPEHVR